MPLLIYTGVFRPRSSRRLSIRASFQVEVYSVVGDGAIGSNYDVCQEHVSEKGYTGQ